MQCLLLLAAVTASLRPGHAAETAVTAVTTPPPHSGSVSSDLMTLWPQEFGVESVGEGYSH